jgi:hypothetical protein
MKTNEERQILLKTIFLRIADSPTLRYFIGPFTATLDNLSALGEDAGLDKDMLSQRIESQEDNYNLHNAEHELKQLIRNLLERASDQGKEEDVRAQLLATVNE